MIATDQPTIFNTHSLVATVSSKSDGNQRYGLRGSSETQAEIDQNRAGFITASGAQLASTALVYVSYDEGRDFETLRVLDDDDLGTVPVQNQPRVADGLFTNRPGVGLYLPLADCNGVILHDEKTSTIGVVHLGRHATIKDLAFQAVKYMEKEFGSAPKDVKAWVSPGIGRNSYAMQRVPGPGHYDFARDSRWERFRRIEKDEVFIDLAGYNVAGLTRAGVPRDNIEASKIDTAVSPDYPSHNKGDTARFAVLAMLKPDA